MSHFKTKQEIWKYVADGGVAIDKHGNKMRFENGNLICGRDICDPRGWSPYIEPVAKTKVWRWEKVGTTSTKDAFMEQTIGLYAELYAAEKLEGYTKVPHSEREI